MMSEVSTALALLTPQPVKLEWEVYLTENGIVEGWGSKGKDYRVTVNQDGKFDAFKGDGIAKYVVTRDRDSVPIAQAACQLHADSQRGGGVVDALRKRIQDFKQVELIKPYCAFQSGVNGTIDHVLALIDEEAGK